MSVRAGGKHPFGGLLGLELVSLAMGYAAMQARLQRAEDRLQARNFNFKLQSLNVRVKICFESHKPCRRWNDWEFRNGADTQRTSWTAPWSLVTFLEKHHGPGKSSLDILDSSMVLLNIM
jgi:hypothetical protein